MRSQRGCDASNAFDEEVNKDEQEFSDDEAEKEFKRVQKLRKKGLLEEGEIPPPQHQRDNNNTLSGKKRPHQKMTRSRFGPSEMPMYSTSMSMAQQMPQ